MATFRGEERYIRYDRALEDKRRHRELVEKSIKENLGDILSEESIVGESKNKRYKIPIKGIKEYQFVYGENNKGVTSGTGEEERGDRISKEKREAIGKRTQAGNAEGNDFYETEITLEEIMEYIGEDLSLPNLDKKKYSEIVINISKKKRGYKRHGIGPRLSKKRSLMCKIARKEGQKRALKDLGKEFSEERFPFREEDLRYYKLKKQPKKESNAVMIFIMDVSGSMDNTKKYLARSFFFLLSRFIKRKYNNLSFEFISHTTTAKNVNEYEFFHKGESGGTYISSGINKAIELIKDKYNPGVFNIYPFYASDGDNWSEDNEKAMEAVREISDLSNIFGYIELLPSTYSTTMFYRFKKEIKNKNFVSVEVKEKKDLWNGIKHILSKEFSEDNR